MNAQLTIRTPENVHIRYDLAGPGSRFFALVIDNLIQGLLLTAFLWPLAKGKNLDLNTLPEKMGLWDGLFLAVLIFFIMLIALGYFIIFECLWDGQTPGKKLLGLKVRRLGGQPVDFLASLLRNLFRIVDILPVFYVAGFLTMFFNSMGRRIGDIVAGTMVIRERRSKAPLPVGLAPEEHEEEIKAWLGGSLPELTEGELGPIREYLRRCDAFAPATRKRLVEGILRRVLVCFRPAGPMPVVDAEQVLRVIYRWYQTANFAREEAEHGREEKPAVSYETP